MRLVVDQIRGLKVEKALVLLKHSTKDTSIRLEKLLLSAIANWQVKYGDEAAELSVTQIFVDSGRMLKRMRQHHKEELTESENAPITLH